MNDCWKTLGLQPTTELAAIKRAYRAQVKRYHPDTVTSPEQKRRYTIICAAINDAYHEAVRRAQAASAAPADDAQAPFAGEPHQETSESAAAGNETEALHRPPYAFDAVFKMPAMLRTLLLLFLGFEVLIFFTGPLQNVPSSVQTLAGLFVALFIGFIVYGLLVAGTMDLLILWLFPRRLLHRLGLARYESKLVWLAVVAANVGLFFFSNLIARPGHQTAAVLLDLAVRTAATVTIPLVALLLWLRDLVRYRRIKQGGPAFADPA